MNYLVLQIFLFCYLIIDEGNHKIKSQLRHKLIKIIVKELEKLTIDGFFLNFLTLFH